MSDSTSDNNDMFEVGDAGVANSDNVGDNDGAEASSEPVKAKKPPAKRTSGRKSGETSGKKVRKERVPMHIRQPIKAAPREGYRRRVVENDPTRIERLKMAGYTMVEDGTAIGDHNEGRAAAPGSTSAKIVNPSSGGWGVLMEIPEEIYQEDLKAKHDKIDQDEESMIIAGGEAVGGDVGEYRGRISRGVDD